MPGNPTTCVICHNEVSLDPDRWVITPDVCEECLHHVAAQSGVPLRDFLDRLGVPVLAVNDDAQVSLANKSAIELLGKDPTQIEARYAGDVFECAYARLPEGCGKTVHCSGCAIRRAVMETFMTGRSLHQVPAYLNRDATTQFLQLGLLISTQKLWGMVLLRIDHIGPAQGPSGHGNLH